MTTYNDAVSASIRAQIGYRALSQRAVASQLGMKPANLSNRLTGNVRWKIDDLEALADAGFTVPPIHMKDAS